jgi:hypothetical protein
MNMIFKTMKGRPYWKSLPVLGRAARPRTAARVLTAVPTTVDGEDLTPIPATVGREDLTALPRLSNL